MGQPTQTPSRHERGTTAIVVAVVVAVVAGLLALAINSSVRREFGSTWDTGGKCQYFGILGAHAYLVQ